MCLLILWQDSKLIGSWVLVPLCSHRSYKASKWLPMPSYSGCYRFMLGLESLVIYIFSVIHPPTLRGCSLFYCHVVISDSSQKSRSGSFEIVDSLIVTKPSLHVLSNKGPSVTFLGGKSIICNDASTVKGVCHKS